MVAVGHNQPKAAGLGDRSSSSPRERGSGGSKRIGAQGLTGRALLFLIGHGAASPFALRGLSDELDVVDGALDDDAHIKARSMMFADLITGRGEIP